MKMLFKYQIDGYLSYPDTFRWVNLDYFKFCEVVNRNSVSFKLIFYSEVLFTKYEF